MSAVKFAADAEGNVIVESDNDSIKLDVDAQSEVVRLILDGYCAICMSSIPQESGLCCFCLNDVFRYHQAQHLCIDTRR